MKGQNYKEFAVKMHHFKDMAVGFIELRFSLIADKCRKVAKQMTCFILKLNKTAFTHITEFSEQVSCWNLSAQRQKKLTLK